MKERLLRLKDTFYRIPFRKRCLLILLFFNALLLVVSVVYAVAVGNALESGTEVIKCAFKERFHLYCPGCGGSRSLYYLLRFDLINSFISYPPLIPAALILIYVDAVALISGIKGDPEILKAIKNGIIIIIPIMIILWFFIRNILLLSGYDILGDIIIK